MVRILFICVGLGLVSCTNSNQTTPETITEAEVHHTLEVWVDGLLENNPQKIDRVLDDSWVYSGAGDGTTVNKSQALSEMSPGETTLKKVTLMDTVVWLYNDVAIIRGWEELVFVEDADTSKMYLRFTDVYEKKDGVVRAIATHSSPISEVEN